MNTTVTSLDIALKTLRKLADRLKRPDEDIDPVVIIVTPWEKKTFDARTGSDSEKTHAVSTQNYGLCGPYQIAGGDSYLDGLARSLSPPDGVPDPTVTTPAWSRRQPSPRAEIPPKKCLWFRR